MYGKTTYIILFITLALSSIALSQKLPTNNFEGNLSPGNFDILLMFRLEEKEDSLITKLYVPAQSVFAEKSSQTIIDSDSLIIYFDRINMSYRAYIDYENKKLTGTYFQRRNKFDLNLYFIDDEDAISFDRPQTPQKLYPYVVQEHIIENKRDDIKLSGSLFLPDTINTHTLAIVLTGSGASTRNELFGGHQTFKVIADYLARNQIAVFIYDERGAGESTGKQRDNTTRTYMTDALNILEYFKKNKNINPEKIGYVGHSEGVLVAMKAASVNKNDVAFIVSLAGPGVPTVELMKKQVEDMYRLSDIDKDTIEILIEYRKKLFDLTQEYDRITDLRKNAVALTEEYAELFNEYQQEKYGLNEFGAHSFLGQYITPWLRYFLKLDPANYIKQVKCPVIALNGDKDIQVHAASNIDAIEKALKEANNENYEVKIFEGLNHIFQPAETGSNEEYMYIQQTISEEVLDTILNFINKL